MGSLKQVFGAVAMLALLAGCETAPLNSRNSGPTATCWVCTHNNDLACEIVHVKDTTPHAEYEGQTYYFCSEGCRAEFLKKPLKYLPKMK
jgi:YHS domain-containing protein